MANKQSTHTSCKHPDCDSSDAYTTYPDGHGYCFSCQRPWFPDDWAKKYSDYEEGDPKDFRGIKTSICEILGIKSFLDDEGNVVYREYTTAGGPSLVRRCGDKKMFWQRDDKKQPIPAFFFSHLFNAGSAHYVTVVEGAEDGAAAYQMLNHGKKTIQPVLALTSSSLSQKQLKEAYDTLRKYETVKLAIEDDDAGKRIKAQLCEMLPNKIREVSMTKHKDANDYLMAGDEKEFTQAWHNAQIYTNDNVYNSEQDFEDIINNEEVEHYVPTPFHELNELIRGISKNYLTIIDGDEGLGKTEVLRAIEYEMLTSGHKIGVLHHEETKKTLLKGLVCYDLWENVRDPDTKVSKEAILKSLKEITNNNENLFVFEFQNDPDVHTIIEQINYLVKVCGVDYILVDPINHFDPVDETAKVQFLDSLAKGLAKYVSKNPMGS
jgi:twinkle protein